MFGVQGYDAARKLPPALLRSALRIERQRQAEEVAQTARLLAVATGLELGKQYVDPSNPSGNRRSDEPYYSLKPFNVFVEAHERIARPWEYTEAAVIRRREAEEAADFDRFEKVIGGLRA